VNPLLTLQDCAVGRTDRCEAGCAAGPAPPPAIEPLASSPHPARTSLRGLDWLVFFLANVQTGFGPFIAVYLTAQAWTQTDIGLVLTAGGLAALAGQMPGGAIVDAASSEKLLAAISIGAIAASALLLAMWPVFGTVLLVEVVHSVASCVLGPTLAAISLGLVGHRGLSERLGRNARFASIGNGLAAAIMGACGYLLSPRAVFICTAILLAPSLWALGRIRRSDIDPERAHGGPHGSGIKPLEHDFLGLARNVPLLILGGCALLFHLANSAMLPLMAGILTARSGNWATVLIAACIVVPQLIVALLSPQLGRWAQDWGRRPILLLGLSVLCVRGVLFAAVSNPELLVTVQILDGIAAACLGIMIPLIIADATRGTGRFNLAQGIVGTAVGIGASLSTALAGFLNDKIGSAAAFLGLAAIAAIGLIVAALALPETRPPNG
jgi:predicted MFS family arabinose efflux permease